VAYLARIKVIAVKAVKAKIRYTAYSSDVGEAARPLVKPWVVNAAYGVVAAYIVGDISYNCKLKMDKEGLRASDWPVVRTAAHATAFQGIASLAIPTFIIHGAVKNSTRLFARHAPGYLKFGPSAVGLACIPFMPLFDEPVEHGIDEFFRRYVPPEYPPRPETEWPRVINGGKVKGE